MASTKSSDVADEEEVAKCTTIGVEVVVDEVVEADEAIVVVVAIAEEKKAVAVREVTSEAAHGAE